MKKIVIAMMIMLAVGVTQAASTLWSTGAVKDPVTGLNIGNGNANFSAIVTFYTDAGGTTLVPGVTGNTDDVASALSALTGTANTFANLTTYYAKVVILSDDGNWKQESSIAGFTVPASPANANINFTTGAGFLVAGNKLGTWEAVPEPTSMALLALGVAALGLRRKFNK